MGDRRDEIDRTERRLQALEAQVGELTTIISTLVGTLCVLQIFGHGEAAQLAVPDFEPPLVPAERAW